MKPATFILVVALLVAAAPAASAALNQRSFRDATNSMYYDDLRMFTTGPSTSNGGPAILIRELLGVNEIAVVATAVVSVEYCTTPITSTPGGPAPILPGASDIACGAQGSYTFPASCLTFTSAIGSFDVNEPIYLGTALTGPTPCNSQVGNPGACPGNPTLLACGGFVSEVCINVDVFDFVVGVTTNEEDTDWFLNVGVLTSASDFAWMGDPANQPDLNSGGIQGTSGAC